ncbi:hypothetical protein PMAYCL1PPCAC_30281, partial [Pristionchus mayeri]
TVESIDKCKGMVEAISDDKAMHGMFTSIFDLLKNLCSKEINAQNFDYDLELMEFQRNLSAKHDQTRNDPLRMLLYALSESIQRTSHVLVAKFAEAKAAGEVQISHEIKAEPAEDVLFQSQEDCIDNDLVEPKMEDVDDSPFFPGFSLEEQKPTTSRNNGSNYLKKYQSTGSRRFTEVPSYSGQRGMYACPLCKGKTTERSLRTLETHLRIHHGKTAKTAKLSFVCACGYIAFNFYNAHDHKKLCGHCDFTMHRSDDDFDPAPSNLTVYRTTVRFPLTATTIRKGAERRESASGEQESKSSQGEEIYICPFCRREVERSLRNLQTHLQNHHRRTCKQARLCFICVCGYSTQIVNDVCKHKRKCAKSFFTMHHTSV